MIWANTSWCVAGVADLFTTLDRAINRFVNDSMREVVRAILIKLTIACAQAPRPQPTAGRLFNKLPETWLPWREIVASPCMERFPCAGPRTIHGRAMCFRLEPLFTPLTTLLRLGNVAHG